MTIEQINELDFPCNQDGSIDIEAAGIPGFLAHLERGNNEFMADLPYFTELLRGMGE